MSVFSLKTHFYLESLKDKIKNKIKKRVQIFFFRLKRLSKKIGNRLQTNVLREFIIKKS
jgi:hypothetical protein